MDNSEPGDSGSPVFVEDLAYGILIGQAGNDAIYMPINYLSSLGVSVLTFDPPASCVICGDGVCEQGESCWVDCTTCGDGICELGEFCSLDCAVCGDGFCESGERCRFDCGFCGDGICQSHEGSECSIDCEGCGGGPCLPE